MPETFFSKDEILEALTLAPCHVTGMHDPTHTIKYACHFQEHEAFQRLLALLGVTVDDLPRVIHETDCFSCRGDHRAQFVAWAQKKPFEFEVRFVSYVYRSGDLGGQAVENEATTERFATHDEAWSFAWEHRAGRKFRIYARSVGTDEWELTSHSS